MSTSATRPLAAVTGASSGIGLELARQFAHNGFDVVIAAEDAELETAAAQLRATGADVLPSASTSTAARPCAWPSSPCATWSRDAGRVLFTSSIASTMPGPFQAVYNASKSFVQSLALALRNELKDTNVTVTSLMPGPTDTEFFERADLEDTKLGAGPNGDRADVARDGFEALMAGKERVVSHSAKTKAQGRGSRFLPDSAKAEMHRKMAEPGSARK
jgi:short-subunit dehydrogenase